MKKLSEAGKNLYRSVADRPLFATLSFFAYRIGKRIRCRQCRPAWGKPVPAWAETEKVAPESLRQVKVAMICDDMTWENWKRECCATALTPHNWKQVLSAERPDVFFCESAWLGRKDQGGCWRGAIYRNHKVLFENRGELLRILDFCKQNGIPTVFWNKEDPTFFDDLRYDFKDTALKFDWIFTTAAECVPRYREMGHPRVDVMMFSFSPYLFSPMGSVPKERRAIFAGSWIGEDFCRCQAMERLFAMTEDSGIPLTIFDRQTRNTRRCFPDKYRSYVRDCVPYVSLGQVIRRTEYALNINTVTDSDTMFARRVFELAASNVVILSNASRGMRKIFPPGGICYLEETFSEEDREKQKRRNLDLVFAQHTNQIRFTDLFCRMGILQESERVRICVLDPDNLLEGRGIAGKWFAAVPVRIAAGLENGQFAYGILLGKGRLRTLDSVLPHFCYLPGDCGIRIVGKPCYEITEDNGHEDVLYPWDLFAAVWHEDGKATKKYLLGDCEV